MEGALNTVYKENEEVEHISSHTSGNNHNPVDSKLTSKSNGAPAGDPAVRAVVDNAVCGRQAGRQDVSGESDWRGKLQEGDVIFESATIVVRMMDNLRHTPRHFIGVRSLLTLAAQEHGHTTRADADVKKRDVKVSQ